MAFAACRRLGCRGGEKEVYTKKKAGKPFLYDLFMTVSLHSSGSQSPLEKGLVLATFPMANREGYVGLAFARKLLNPAPDGRDGEREKIINFPRYKRGTSISPPLLPKGG